MFTIQFAKGKRGKYQTHTPIYGLEGAFWYLCMVEEDRKRILYDGKVIMRHSGERVWVRGHGWKEADKVKWLENWLGEMTPYRGGLRPLLR